MKLALISLLVPFPWALACGRTELQRWDGGPSAAAGAGGHAQDDSGGKAPVCGDGRVDLGEACDPGPTPSAPALEIRQGSWRAPIRPLVGAAEATTHYAYRSRSSHTGFEAAEKSRLYLYRSASEAALNLVFLNGIDEDASGVVQPASEITFEIAGLPNGASILVSDDDVEFTRTAPDTAVAEWDCNRNSDGGVIGGLPFPGAWRITITAAFRAGISSWSFLSGALGPELAVDGELLLDPSRPIEILASDVVGCREDCSAPVCGDELLDPGEVCDDANDAAGDGCFDCHPSG